MSSCCNSKDKNQEADAKGGACCGGGDKTEAAACGSKPCFFTRYRPLFVIVLLSIAAALAITIPIGTSWMHGMHMGMGTLLLFFAALKLFDIRGFQRGFIQYDLVTKAVPVYGFIYPFLELALALLYLSQIALAPTYIATIVIMLVGGAGIIRAIIRGKTPNCACMGAVLDVPLGAVSIVENFGMATMAAAMLLLV